MEERLLLIAPYKFDSDSQGNKKATEVRSKAVGELTNTKKNNFFSKNNMSVKFSPPEGMDWDQYGNPYFIENCLY